MYRDHKRKQINIVFMWLGIRVFTVKGIQIKNSKY